MSAKMFIQSNMDVRGNVPQAGDAQEENEGNLLVKELSIFSQYPVGFSLP